MTKLRCDIYICVCVWVCGWVGGGVCVSNRILFSHKKELNHAICSNMENIMLSEIHQKETTNSVSYHLYVGSKLLIQMKAYTTEKQTHRKQACSYQRGEDRGYYVQNLVITDTEDY